MVGSIWWPVGCQSWVHLMAVKHQDIHFPGCWRGGSNKSFGNLTNLNTLLANIMVLLILIMIISSDRKTLKFGFHPNCPGGAPSFRKNHLGFSRQARTMPWTEKLHSWQQLVGSFKSKKWKNAPWTITARLFCQKKGICLGIQDQGVDKQSGCLSWCVYIQSDKAMGGFSSLRAFYSCVTSRAVGET